MAKGAKAETGTHEGFAVAYLDPDFRRQPKTDLFCFLCQRDIRGKEAGRIHVIGGGSMVLAVADYAAWTAKRPNDAGDMGAHPIGPDCARKLPKGFVHV